MSESTVRRWRHGADFDALVDSMTATAVDATSQALAEGAALMAGEVAGSVATLASIRDDPEAGPQARRMAARDLLTLALTFRSHAALEARVEALEAAENVLQAGQGGRNGRTWG